MRWESLFDDLEGQMHHESFVDDADVRADEERHRLSKLTLRDRLRAAADAGGPVRVRLVTGRSLEVQVDAFGRDWVSGEVVSATSRAMVVLPIAGIAALLIGPRRIADSLNSPRSQEGDITDKLTLGVALRDLCRRRVPVTLHSHAGDATGTIDRVGRDHLDLALHERDVPRRASEVRLVEVVPFDSIVLVSC